MRVLAGIVASVLMTGALVACAPADPAAQYKDQRSCEAAGYEWDSDTRTVKKKVGTKYKKVRERYWHCESD